MIHVPVEDLLDDAPNLVRLDVVLHRVGRIDTVREPRNTSPEKEVACRNLNGLVHVDVRSLVIHPPKMGSNRCLPQNFHGHHVIFLGNSWCTFPSSMPHPHVERHSGCPHVPCRFPPVCLKKNGTPATAHWWRKDRTHAGSVGRGCGSDSPPAMIHSMSRRRLPRYTASAFTRTPVANSTIQSPSLLLKSIGPNSGSHDRKCTPAGTATSCGMRISAYF